jgi:hypothetical protein
MTMYWYNINFSIWFKAQLDFRKFKVQLENLLNAGFSTIMEIISVDLFETHLVLLSCKAILFLVNTYVHDR